MSETPEQQTEAMPAAGSIAQAYVDALNHRDLEACMNLFAQDASVHFMNSRIQGRSAIERWHKDRFSAELEVLKTSKPITKGDVVAFDGVVTSKLLRRLRLQTLSGRATVRVKDGNISELKLGLGNYNLYENW